MVQELRLSIQNLQPSFRLPLLFGNFFHLKLEIQARQYLHHSAPNCQLWLLKYEVAERQGACFKSQRVNQMPAKVLFEIFVYL